jgi:hypothetical protein
MRMVPTDSSSVSSALNSLTRLLARRRTGCRRRDVLAVRRDDRVGELDELRVLGLLDVLDRVLLDHLRDRVVVREELGFVLAELVRLDLEEGDLVAIALDVPLERLATEVHRGRARLRLDVADLDERVVVHRALAVRLGDVLRAADRSSERELAKALADESAAGLGGLLECRRACPAG